MLVSTYLLLAPLPAFSGSMTSTQALELQQRGQLPSTSAEGKNVNVGLDKQGNVMIRIGGISVTLQRGTPENSQENLYGSRSSTRQDVASLGAIRVNIDITF